MNFSLSQITLYDIYYTGKLIDFGSFFISIQRDQSWENEGKEMKNFRKELWFDIPTRRAFVNITPKVDECLRESGIKEGLLLCNAMHITASVFINDDEPGLHQDYDEWLEKLAPHEPTSKYRHNRTGEDNGDAHLKRQVMGREVVVAITGGKLDFGPWEQIFYGEFDGRRKKRVLVKIIGE
jgi:secondary thiamine-phosphate synthase enzyme